MGGFSFHFLPDGRIIVGERPGRIKIVAKDGKVSEPLAGMPANLRAAGQGLYEVLPDKSFSANRTLYLTYAALPMVQTLMRYPAAPVSFLSPAQNCPPTTDDSKTSRCC
jgi:hypothetical protein